MTKRHNPRRSSNQAKATAYHEAGHAVIAHYLHIRVMEASIEPNEFSSGHVKHQRLLNKTIEFDRSDRNRLKMERLVIICLAGLEAQRRASPRSVRYYHAQMDYENAVSAVEYFTESPEEEDAYIKYLVARTKNLIFMPDRWDEIVAVAAALLKEEKLTGEQIVQTIHTV
jgi:ATP-dependent Zn protease